MHRSRRGFSCIELSIAITVLGIGATALLEFLGNATSVNREAADLTTATRLARSVNEYALTLDHTRLAGSSINDLIDLNGKTFSPPRDSRGVALGAEMARWQQTIQVSAVDAATLAESAGPILEDQPKRLIVTVAHNGKAVYVQRWLLCPMISE